MTSWHQKLLLAVSVALLACSPCAAADSGQQTDAFDQTSNPPQPYNAPSGGFTGTKYPPGWHNHNSKNVNYQHFDNSNNSNNNYSNNYNNYNHNSSRTRIYSRPDYGVIPSGLVLPMTLDTSISVKAAKEGDYVQCHITQNVSLGGGTYLPGGTVLTGEMAPEEPGHHEHGGNLSMAFTQMRLPSGTTIPIQGHLVGKIATYENREDPLNNEGMGQRLAQIGMHSGVGAGLGGVFGAAEGSIASGGRGFSAGTWSGAAMGASVGALSSLIWRHGRPELLHAGTTMQLQLDEPAQIPGPNDERGPGGAI